MPIKRLTLKEWKELGLPIHRSYIKVYRKPLSNRKLKKYFNSANKPKDGKNG